MLSDPKLSEVYEAYSHANMPNVMDSHLMLLHPPSQSPSQKAAYTIDANDEAANPLAFHILQQPLYDMLRAVFSK